MIMNEHSKQANDLLNRRSFIKGGAGAVLPTVTASFLTGLNLRGTGFAALMYATSMYNKLKRLSIVFIAFISFPGLAYNQQPPIPPSTKLVPPAHGKIPVAFIIGRGAETIDVVGPWTVFQAVLDQYR